MTLKRAALIAGLSAMPFMFIGAPANAGYGYSSDYCREYTKTVYVGGRAVESYGTACLQPDGAWRIKGSGERISAPPERVTYAPPPRTVVYKQPVYYRPASTWSFFWGTPSHKHNHHKYRNVSHRYDRHDRHNNHRGHGHKKHRGKGHH